MRRPALAVLVVAGAVLLAPAAGASAAERIVAIPQSQYATQNVAIDQGEPLTFLNLDVLSHDVTARGKGANGQPLFSTPLIGTGEEVPVEGTDSLGPGEYSFFCSVHPNMEGTLTVGGGGAGGGGSDTSVRILDSKLSEVRKAKALSVEMTVAEPSKMRVSARAKVSGETAGMGKAKHEFDSDGSHAMEIPLSKEGRSALRGADKAKVVVKARAKTADGAKSSARDTATLR